MLCIESSLLFSFVCYDTNFFLNYNLLKKYNKKLVADSICLCILDEFSIITNEGDFYKPGSELN